MNGIYLGGFRVKLRMVCAALAAGVVTVGWASAADAADGGWVSPRSWTWQAARDYAGVPAGTWLARSGSIRVTRPGAVVTGRDVHGGIVVAADNVTVRLNRVTVPAGGGVHFGIYVKRGVTGTVIERNTVVLPSADCVAAGVAGGSRNTVVGNRVTGCGDGYKVQSDSLYAGNVATVSKPAGHEAHLDGMQGSGANRATVQGNYVDIPAARGGARTGNQAILLQCYQRGRDVPSRGLRVVGNYFDGGGITVSFEDGKRTDGCLSVTYTGNTVGRDQTHRPLKLQGVTR